MFSTLSLVSPFDEKLAEDRRVNRLEDSYLLWRSVCSCKLLSRTQIILCAYPFFSLSSVSSVYSWHRRFPPHSLVRGLRNVDADRRHHSAQSSTNVTYSKPSFNGVSEYATLYLVSAIERTTCRRPRSVSGAFFVISISSAFFPPHSKFLHFLF